ncbi:hypothetical protein BJ085DRAFT_34282, partial [Dimargaris cristalligena]
MFSDDTDALFDCFEAAEPTTPAVLDLAKLDLVSQTTTTTDPSADPSKRKIENEYPAASEKAVVSTQQRASQDILGPQTKKTRVAKKEMVLADEFEQDTEREVAAAGLLPTEEGASLKLSHQVRHQVALPPDYPYVPISQHKSPENPARTYPFTLDPFQRVSIASIERSESVLVSAHTSAGKTVVAEYAIALSLREKQRVIYT